MIGVLQERRERYGLVPAVCFLVGLGEEGVLWEISLHGAAAGGLEKERRNSNLHK
jgi:hypothetical protein